MPSAIVLWQGDAHWKLARLIFVVHTSAECFEIPHAALGDCGTFYAACDAWCLYEYYYRTDDPLAVVAVPLTEKARMI